MSKCHAALTLLTTCGRLAEVGAAGLSRSTTMINGAHMVVYSKNADADRAFIRDVLKFSHIDAHGGWLIFKPPPAELAVHPSDENDMHELYLMTDDLELEIRALQKAGVKLEPVA